MSKQKTNKKCIPSREHPELMELLTDLGAFVKKWNVPKIASSVGISKQSLYEDIERKPINFLCEQGYTQTEIGRALGVSKQFIQQRYPKPKKEKKDDNK